MESKTSQLGNKITGEARIEGIAIVIETYHLFWLQLMNEDDCHGLEKDWIDREYLKIQIIPFYRLDSHLKSKISCFYYKRPF